MTTNCTCLPLPEPPDDNCPTHGEVTTKPSPEDRDSHATDDMTPLGKALADVWLDLDDGGYSEQRLSVLLKEAGCDDDAMDKLANRLSQALTDAGYVIEQGWVSMDEELPPRHESVWCLNRDGWQFEGRICYGMHKPFMTYPRGDGNASNTAPAWIDVTHWRPLPKSPTQQDTTP